MLRVFLGVVSGFFAWVFALIGGEMILSAILPEAFGAHQRAFQKVIEEGGAFTASSTHLILHTLLGSIASLLAGFVSAIIAGENKRAPMVLGFLMLALGLLKAVMSWQYVPLWYHVVFTVMLLPLVILGGRLRSERKSSDRAGADPTEPRTS
jgi:hypothetical protein